MFGREDAARRLWAVRQSAGAYARALCKWVLLAGSTGLYSSQTILYSKLKARYINIHTNSSPSSAHEPGER